MSSLTFFARNTQDVQPFLKAGFRVVDFSVPFGWKGAEQYEFTESGAVMDEFLKTDPNLLLLPRFDVTPWWCPAFPGEIRAAIAQHRAGRELSRVQRRRRRCLCESEFRGTLCSRRRVADPAATPKKTSDGSVFRPRAFPADKGTASSDGTEYNSRAGA